MIYGSKALLILLCPIFLESTKAEKTPEEIDALCFIIGNMYLGMYYFVTHQFSSLQSILHSADADTVNSSHSFTNVAHLYHRQRWHLQTFILVMVFYLEILKKGQKMMDVALGGKRLPTSADAGSTSYMDTIINEVLR